MLSTSFSRALRIVEFVSPIYWDSVSMMFWLLQSMIAVHVAKFTILNLKRRKFIIMLIIVSFEQDPKRDSYGYEATLLSELQEEVRQCDRRIKVPLTNFA